MSWDTPFGIGTAVYLSQWNDIMTTTGKPLWNYAYGLYQAMAERCATDAGGDVTEVQRGVAPSDVQRTIGRVAPFWGLAADALVDHLVPRFINHQDAMFATAPPLAPNWTMAAALAAIGAESRMTCGLQPHRAWLEQTWRLLDLLRWTRNATLFEASTTQRTGSAPSYAAAVSAYAAASWGVSGLSGPRQVVVQEDDVAMIRRTRTAYNITQDGNVGQGWYLYGRFAAPAGGTYINPDWPSAGIGDHALLATRFTTGPEGFGALTVGDIATVTLPDLGTATYGWALDGMPVLLRRWDVPGGFIRVTDPYTP